MEICINFPKRINILDTPNKLYEYFTFENFDSGNDSNVVVE